MVERGRALRLHVARHARLSGLPALLSTWRGCQNGSSLAAGHYTLKEVGRAVSDRWGSRLVGAPVRSLSRSSSLFQFVPQTRNFLLVPERMSIDTP